MKFEFCLNKQNKLQYRINLGKIRNILRKKDCKRIIIDRDEFLIKDNKFVLIGDTFKMSHNLNGLLSFIKMEYFSKIIIFC